MEVFIKRVIFSKKAEKQLLRVPRKIAEKLKLWVGNVEINGLEEVRCVRGYRDEMLKGKLIGYRSIRLSKAYRALYFLTDEGEIVIEEVNKHEY